MTRPSLLDRLASIEHGMHSHKHTTHTPTHTQTHRHTHTHPTTHTTHTHTHTHRHRGLVNFPSSFDRVTTKECTEYAPHSACTVWFNGFTHALTCPTTQKHALTVVVCWYLNGSTCFEYSSTVFQLPCMFPFVSGVSLPPATRQVTSPHNISVIVMDVQQHVTGTQR
jgi:hypothetical protein